MGSVSAHGSGAGIGWSLTFLPTQTILWFWIHFSSIFTWLKSAFSISEQFQKWKEYKSLTSIQLLRQGYCHDELSHWNHSMSAFPKHSLDYYILFDLQDTFLSKHIRHKCCDGELYLYLVTLVVRTFQICLLPWTQ